MWRSNAHQSETGDSVRLSELEDGQTAVIIAVDGGRHVIKRLADLGITSGTDIKIVRKTLLSGPIQVEVSGSRLVLGWGLASKIQVELHDR